ncbi:MAG: DUF4054 domain-containing protein [Succinivibrio sp.]|nr:DUF4054 domain-containing protein [Succinivibrio sp.]
MAAVIFDADSFRSRYPRFTEELVPDAMLEETWEAAVSLCGNDDASSPFPYKPDAEPPVTTRKWALYLAMCHLLTMELWPQGQQGPITNASEGSVSTAFQLLQGKTTTESWWLQTPCGARYWMMIKPFIMGGHFYGSDKYHPWG